MKYGLTTAALAAILSLAGCGSSIHLPSPDGDVSVAQNGTITFRTEGAKNSYAPVLTIIRTPRDPELKMRPAGIGNVLYNAATWRSENGDAGASSAPTIRSATDSTRASSKEPSNPGPFRSSMSARISKCALPEPSPTERKSASPTPSTHFSLSKPN